MALCQGSLTFPSITFWLTPRNSFFKNFEVEFLSYLLYQLICKVLDKILAIIERDITLSQVTPYTLVIPRNSSFCISLF